MKIDVVRKWFTTRASMGEISIINDPYRAFSIEDVARAAGVKIKRETAIPAGTYNVEWTWSPRHNIFLPQIMSVPMFEGVRFDKANYAEQLEGCIAVGAGRGDNAVWDSAKAHSALCEKIEAAAKRKELIWVEIKNQQENV